MRTLTVKLDADDTPRSITYLATLATAIPQLADANNANPVTVEGRKLRSRHIVVAIYAESGNDPGDATHSEARVSFESTDVTANFTGSRADATAHGIRLLPGILTPLPSSGAVGIYDFRTTTLVGKTNDRFQVIYDPA